MYNSLLISIFLLISLCCLSRNFFHILVGTLFFPGHPTMANPLMIPRAPAAASWRIPERYEIQKVIGTGSYGGLYIHIGPTKGKID